MKSKAHIEYVILLDSSETLNIYTRTLFLLPKDWFSHDSRLETVSRDAVW